MTFGKKEKQLLHDDLCSGIMGIKRMAHYQLTQGMSSLTSSVFFLSDIDDDEVRDIPDYILSDTLDKDIDSAVVTCAIFLKKSKYLPAETRLITRGGMSPDGKPEGVLLETWENYELRGADGEPLYTREEVADSISERDAVLLGMTRIVKEISDCGEIFSHDWYCARILQEYFLEMPVPRSNAYLIGLLWQEMCLKESFEADLEGYYERLEKEKADRLRGAEKTKRKAEELRDYCVEVAVMLAHSQGAKFMMAPAEIQANEIRAVALAERAEDFVRGGKHYSDDWFRNAVEDRRLDIVEAINANSEASKKA